MSTSSTDENRPAIRDVGIFAVFALVIYNVYLFTIGTGATVCSADGTQGLVIQLLKDFMALVLLPLVITIRNWRLPAYRRAALVPLACFALHELIHGSCLLPFGGR